MMHQHPYFIDTTLRDGEQAPGVAFSFEEKCTIASLLDETGVPELEIGIPAMGDAAIKEIRAINRLGFRFKTLAWSRALEQDIIRSVHAHTDGIHLSFPVSDILLKCMNKTQDWVMEELHRLVRLASREFSYVTIGAQDASRANPWFLRAFAREVLSTQATRLRLADTVGILNPYTTTKLIDSIRSLDLNLSLEFHGHNDLGMACANTLSAWMAGADCLSTTVNGLGERAGNAAMEEVAMALELSANVPVSLDKTRFPILSRYVSEASGRTNAPSKPITGETVFTHESGIHTHCMMQDRNAYQLFSATLLGLEETPFSLGKHSNKAMLINRLNELGQTCTPEQASLLLQATRNWCSLHKRTPKSSELLMLFETINPSKTIQTCILQYNRNGK